MKSYTYSVLPYLDFIPGTLSTFLGENGDETRPKRAAFDLAEKLLLENFDYVTIIRVVRDE